MSGYFPDDSEAQPHDGDVAALQLSMIESGAEDLATAFANPLPEWDLEQHCKALQGVQEARRQLADAEQGLKDSIGRLMGQRTVVVEGFGVLIRSTRKNRTRWDTDDLLRLVLDTKIVDPETGAIHEETDVQKILDVWRLPAPRLTALKHRGIDADEFCESETRKGWDIRMDAP